MTGDSVAVPATSAEESSGDNLVAILLAMAMFVLVVDTSLMNVSISALVASLLGLLNGFRMTRLPDPEPSAAAEGLLAG